MSRLNNAWVVERPREDDTKSTPAPHLAADTDTKTKNCAAEREAANVLESDRLRHAFYAIWKIAAISTCGSARRYLPPVVSVTKKSKLTHNDGYLGRAM